MPSGRRKQIHLQHGALFALNGTKLQKSLMKISKARFHLAALVLGSSIGLTSVVLAQPATKARRITVAQYKSYKWPTYRQVYSAKRVPEVKVIQYLLRNQGFFKGQPDGIFGTNTARSVQAFQRAKGLKADGVVGAQTWRHLLLRLKRGDKGDAVRALQTTLRQITDHVAEPVMPDLPVDGIFGFKTEEAVRTAQEHLNWPEKRVAVDGIAGPQLWSFLVLPSAT